MAASTITSPFFISYSRKQFYFAESLALTLQGRGVPTWFDIQRLKPGRDWYATIQAGLDSCAGVILIASRASIESTYVQAEWKHMLAIGRPVYVVVFEAVELPAELRAAPIFDFRDRFEQNVAALSQALVSDEPPRRSAPKPNLLRLPARLPIGVWVVIIAFLSHVALWLIASYGFAAELHSRGELYGSIRQALPVIASLGLLWAIQGVLAIYCLCAFLFRRFQQTTKWYLVALPLIAWNGYRSLGGLVDYLEHGGTLGSAMTSPRPFFLGQFLIAFFVVLVLSTIAFIIMARSGDILRWSTTGEASEKLRKRLNQHLLQSSTQDMPIQQRKTYQIHYETVDEGIAGDIQRAMLLHGHVLQQHDPATAEVHIAIINDRTSKQWVNDVIGSYSGELVCVAATSVRVPDNLVWFHKYQWVDYRNRSFERLTTMAEHLARPAADRAAYNFSFVPESLLKPIAPLRISGWSHTLRFLAALNLSSGLFSILTILQGTTSDTASRLTLLGLPVGIFLFWLAGKLVARQMSHRFFVAAFCLSWLLMIVSGLSSSLYNAGYSFAGYNTAWIYIGGALVGFLIVYGHLRGWLPRYVPRPRTAEAILGTPRNLRYALSNALLLLFMTSIVLSGFVGIATIKADPALDPLLGARPFLPAPAALTPIEQARQRFAEHLLNAPEVQAAFANLRADEVPARLVELSNNGIRRLDDESLRKRAVLIGKLYQAADTQSCAQLWQGTATTEQVNRLLGSLAPNDIDTWFALSEQAVLAELRRVPAARHPGGAQIDAALGALLADLPPSQARRLQQALNATVLSDSDACWAGRTLFGNVVALDEPYRSTLLLALVQTK